MVAGNTFRVTNGGPSIGVCLPLENSAWVESDASREVVNESEELDADGGGVGNQCDFGSSITGLRPSCGELAPDEVVLDVKFSVKFSPRVVNESGSSLSMP